jgi:BirA family biotin operon repressor/biotin-[acetyl-CoA-carboxylase] ligase
LEVSADLSADAVTEALGDRPVRVYPALLSTEADAQSWARSGGPDGGVVTAAYQVSPRGRAGLPWEPDPGADVAFSLLVRPRLSAEREGWLYAASAAGVADAVGAGARWRWPDEIERDGEVVARLGLHAELGAGGVDWAVVTVLRHRPGGDRARALATMVEHIERAHARLPEEVLADLRPRCATLGEDVRALMIPMGPSGPRVEGVAIDLKDDGALLIRTPAGGRIAVRPQHLGLLEPLDSG